MSGQREPIGFGRLAESAPLCRAELCRQGRDKCPVPESCHISADEAEDFDRELRAVVFLACVALLAVAAVAFTAALLP